MVELEPRGPLGLGVEAVRRTPARRARRSTPRAVAGAPSASPTSSSRSRAYSRIVSSIRKRSSPIGFTRLEVDERREGVEVGVADLLGSLEREAAGEDGEAREELAARGVEEVVAPLDRRAQRALALGRVARAARQQRERRVEALEQRARARGASSARPRARSPAGGRRGGGRSPSTVASGASSRPTARARSTKSAAASLGGSGSSRYSCSPETRSGARLVTSTRRPLRRGEERRSTVGRRVEEMLEVVEEEQQLPSAEEAGEVVGRADRLRDLRGHELGVGEAGERHPEDAVAQRADELGRDLEREARLAGAAGPGEREQARAVREQRDELVELALPADERARGDGQVRGVERRAAAGSRRRRAGRDARRRTRSFSRCSPRSRTAASRVEEAARRLGEDDLPAVCGRGDARGAVDVDADVALVGHERLAGVDPHAHADRAALERVARLGGGGDRVGGAREGDEEGVALRVDLDAAVRGERLPQRAAVLGEELRVAPRRAPGAAASSPRRP